jgi:integrase
MADRAAVRQRGSSIQKVTLRNGEVRWRFRLDLSPGPDGKRRQQTVTCTTEAEAIARQAKGRTQVADRTYVEPDRRTVADVLEAYESAHALDWRASTAAQNASALLPIRELLGAKRAQQLDRADIERAARKMLAEGGRSGAGRSPRTVRIAVQLTKAALALAVRDGVVPRNVADGVRLPRVDEHEKGLWSAAELARFLAHVEDHPLVGVFHLLALGMRRGEVLGATWADVDDDRATVRVRQTRVIVGREVVTQPPKTARSRREVPLTADALRALRLTRERTMSGGVVVPLRQRASAGAGRFIAVDVSGQPMRPDTFAREFHRLADDAGLPRIRVHDVRHSVATIMLENGVQPHVAAGVLGHDPAVLMKVYAHVTDTSAASAIASLGVALGQR